MRLVPLVSCFAVACAAPDPQASCENFLDAKNGCYRDYAKEQGTEPKVIDLATCAKETSGLADNEKKAAADRYDCMYDVYANASCRDVDQFKSANSDADACK